MVFLQLVSNLSELRNMLTANDESIPFTVFTAADPLDHAAGLVLSSLLATDGCRSVARTMKDHRRMHGIIKALVTVGSQLVTLGEYRDFYEDLLTKVLYCIRCQRGLLQFHFVDLYFVIHYIRLFTLL